MTITYTLEDLTTPGYCSEDHDELWTAIFHADQDELKRRLKAMPYRAFLRTPYWRAISDRVKAMSGRRCVMCSSVDSLAAHHNTYANHGAEHDHLRDMTCLCDSCHKKHHGIEEKPVVDPSKRKRRDRQPRTKRNKREQWVMGSVATQPHLLALLNEGVIMCPLFAPFLTIKTPAYHWLKANGLNPAKKGWQKRTMGRWLPLACFKQSKRASLRAMGVVTQTPRQ